MGLLGKNNIAAVIVSHAPGESFYSNVNCLKFQVGKIIIVSNGAEILLDGAEVIRNSENVGQGRALNQGAERAMSLGYEWILFLDQDSILSKDMVERQIEAYNLCQTEKPAIIGCNCVFGNLNRSKYQNECRDKKFFSRNIVMMSGMLLSATAFRKVGLFRENFFIDSLDTDYCLRVQAAGYKTIVACGAFMNQNVGERAFFRKFLGKEFLVTNHPAKRCYYMTRNGLTLAFEYLFKYPAWAGRRFAWQLLIKPGLIILYEKDKFIKIKSIFKGAFHALINKTGKI